MEHWTRADRPGPNPSLPPKVAAPKTPIPAGREFAQIRKCPSRRANAQKTKMCRLEHLALKGIFNCVPPKSLVAVSPSARVLQPHRRRELVEPAFDDGVGYTATRFVGEAQLKMPSRSRRSTLHVRAGPKSTAVGLARFRAIGQRLIVSAPAEISMYTFVGGGANLESGSLCSHGPCVF